MIKSYDALYVRQMRCSGLSNSLAFTTKLKACVGRVSKVIIASLHELDQNV